MLQDYHHIHLISDATGDTLQTLAKACLAQFPNVDYQLHPWPLIRSKIHLSNLLNNEITQKNVLILYTILDKDLQNEINQFAQDNHHQAISVLSPLIDNFSRFFNSDIIGKTGSQHEMNEEYFNRIDAMQFALYHDDGQNINELKTADIIVIGVSRTSKTPTCMYLANKGYRVANIPFVRNIPLPQRLFELLESNHPPFVVGLTKSPEQLIDIRKSRLDIINDHSNKNYIDIEEVTSEVKECKLICRRHGWSIIDVSKKSIEETVATIITHYNRARP